MTPEAQRIALAEFCGWTQSQDDNDPTWWTHAPDEKYFFGDMEKYWPLHVIPDYLNDLNAVHEVEKQLSALDHQKFCLFLHKSILGTMNNFDIDGTCNLECISRVVKAEAPQRCEAILRTLGRWME